MAMKTLNMKEGRDRGRRRGSRRRDCGGGGILFVVCLLFLEGLYAQQLGGTIESISEVTTCSGSDLSSGQLAGILETQGIESPCADIGGDANVLTMLVRITPNLVAGGTVFELTLNHLPNGDAENYDPTQPCSGTAQGADCIVLSESIVLTFGSTQLMNGYTVRRRLGFNFPYGYLGYISTQGISANLFLKTFVADCSTLSNMQQINNPSMLFGTGSANPCPSSISHPSGFSASGTCDATTGYTSDDPNCYYILGASSAFSNQECGFLGCIYFDDYEGAQGIWARTLSPTCDLHDINEGARAVMNIKVEVGSATNSSEFAVARLSTERFQTVAIVDSVYTRLVSFQTGLGATGQNLGGAIVTCSACQNGDDATAQCESPSTDGSPNTCASQLLFDYGKPGLANLDDLTIPLQRYVQDNPDTHCSYPSANCRAAAGGCPGKSLWYYVRPEYLSMFNTGCSGNGVSPLYYTQSQAAAEDECFHFSASKYQDKSDFSLTCFPGYEQSGTLPGQQNSVTPCLVEQLWANQMVNDLDTQGQESVEWMPQDYIRGSPNYALQGNTLLTPFGGGQSDDASVLVQVVLAGTFDSLITRFAPGEFVDSHMNCDGITDGGSGEILFTVKNTGASVGTYEVFAELQIANDGVSISNITSENYYQLTSPSATVEFEGGNTVTFQVAAGQLGGSALAFLYSGGVTDGLIARLNLTAPITGQSQFLDSEVFSCGLFGGTSLTGDLQGISTDIQEVYNFLQNPDGLSLSWYQLLLLAILLLLLLTAAISTCCWCCQLLGLDKQRRKLEKMYSGKQA